MESTETISDAELQDIEVQDLAPLRDWQAATVIGCLIAGSFGSKNEDGNFTREDRAPVS